MKQLFLILSLIFISCMSNAQLTKGNWLVGGNLSFTSYKNSGSNSGNNSSIYLTASPNIGYFFIDKLAVGIKTNITSITDKNPQPDGSINKVTQKNIGFGSFVRYYFLPTEKKLNIISEASILYTTNSNNSTSVNSKSFEYAIYAGPVIYFNPTVGIEFLLGYNRLKLADVDYRNNSLQFKIGLQIHLEKE